MVNSSESANTGFDKSILWNRQESNKTHVMSDVGTPDSHRSSVPVLLMVVTADFGELLTKVPVKIVRI